MCPFQRVVLAVCVLCMLGLLHKQHSSIIGDARLDFVFRDIDDKSQIVQSNTARRTQILQDNNGSDSAFSHPLENTCKYPVIYTDEKDIQPFVEHYREVKCVSDQPNLVSMDREGYIYVHRDFDKQRQKKVPKFSCFYRALTGSLFPHVTDFKWSGEQHEIPKNERYWINEDQFVVRCFNSSLNHLKKHNSSIIFERAYAHFANKNKTYADAAPDKLSLSILVLDSTSLNQFRRHAPRTMDFMEKLGFEFLEGYNKVADNSMVNLMPVLANLIYTNLSADIISEVLPLTYMNERVVLEDINFPWNDMKKRDCVTMLNDDIGSIGRGLFHYPSKQVKGFVKPPTDYYYRPYYIYNYRNLISNTSQQCTHDQPSTEVYLDIWEQFSMKFKDKCHFSFNFLTYLTHDNPNYLEVVDERLRTSLERMFANGVMDNTVLVVMGDHGNRIGAIQHAFVGRIEERMPLFSILLPESFKRRFPTLVSNLRINTNRFVSNFDIYQTLKDIYTGRYLNEEIFREGRGISLFDFIPTDRTCSDVTVPENFCTCMERRNLRQSKDSKQFKTTVAIVKDWLAIQSFACILADSIDAETIETYSINQMVRHGLRDMSVETLKRLSAQAALEYLYVELTATIALLNGERVKFITRVQQNLYEQSFRMNVDPLIIDSSAVPSCRSAKTFDRLCSCYQASS
uniref:Uncharacterized protein n=1 Tax=Plectus sambesii TaxID=2011161 RepID=A0A914WHD5_9BILA